MEIKDINYFKKFDISNFIAPYISMLVTSLGRKAYLTQCVDSIIRNADLHAEIIISDDGSNLNMQREILTELHDKCSAFVFNPGLNAGLARAWNRARGAATSKYLMGIPDDNFFTSPFLKRVKWALDKPYVGTVSIVPKINVGPDCHILPDGSPMVLSRNIGNPNVFGVRAEVWDEVGGWDPNVQTSSSDASFFGHLFSKGYFAVLVEGTYTNEMWPLTEDKKSNVGGTNHDYVAASAFSRGDTNIPNIFHKDRPFNMVDHYHMSDRRRNQIWHGVNDLINADKLSPAWPNGNFCCNESNKLYSGTSFVNWEFAKTYGHDKHRKQMEEDFKQ